MQCEAGTVVPAAGLSAWFRQRFAAAEPDMDRIVDEAVQAAADADAIDFYVPLPDRRFRRDPAAWFRAASVYRTAAGVLVLGATAPASSGHRYGYADTLLALACSGEPSGTDLVFLHRREDVPAADLTQLCARYGLGRPEDADAAEFTVRMPAESLATWCDTPAERTNAFYRTFLHVSGRIQTLLRAWLRYQWFSDPSRFDDLVASRAMMMYWLSTPHRGESRTEFTYDVLSLESVKKLCRVGANRFGAELDMIGERLTRAGRTAAGHCYRSLHTREIMAAVRKERRTVARFIAAESEITDILINFSVRVRSHAGRVRDIAEAAADTLYTLRTSLRRLPVAGWEHDLAILVLMEATAAVQAAAGLPGTLRTTLSIARRENKRAA